VVPLLERKRTLPSVEGLKWLAPTKWRGETRVSWRRRETELSFDPGAIYQPTPVSEVSL
jgi:hypothetical protein